MIPIYTTYLSPQEYGIAERLDLTSMIIGLALGFGITAATLAGQGPPVVRPAARGTKKPPRIHLLIRG